jgi:CRP-like cAMP-binding protein
MITIADATQNHLLALLSENILLRWLPNLDWVEMPRGAVLYESDAKADFVYFPISAIVSLDYVLGDGPSAEIAVVGKEGVVGIFVAMGGTTTTRAAVQYGGQAVRMPATEFKREFKRSRLVLQLMLRYTQALTTQMTQTAVCNRHHSLAQQLCRLLLLRLDRLHGDELSLTQELIARMLGVRREGVHEAARTLQDVGLIRYARGHISILNRQELERRSCECYAVVKREYDRLLPGKPAR